MIKFSLSRENYSYLFFMDGRFVFRVAELPGEHLRRGHFLFQTINFNFLIVRFLYLSLAEFDVLVLEIDPPVHKKPRN